MKRNYYCQIAGLQDITLDTNKLALGQLDLKNELKDTIHPDDFRLVEHLFLQYDNTNLLNLLFKPGKAFDHRGNYTLSQLEEGIKLPEGNLPEYMAQFIQAIKDANPAGWEIIPENRLTALYYEYCINANHDFLHNWFSFSRNLNNVKTALLCRKHNLPYDKQLLGMDEITDTMRRSNARDFGVGSEMPFMDELINIIRMDDFQEREKALDKIRWDYLDDITFFEYFTIDRILAFFLKLDLVNRWLLIDKKHGTQMFDALLNDLKSGFKIPDGFTEK